LSQLKRKLRQRTEKAGIPPGTLQFSGEKRVESVLITRYEYDTGAWDERHATSLDEIGTEKRLNSVLWINIDGLHQTDVIAAIGERYQIHPLVLEDILHTDQRPKLENYGHYLYLVVKMFEERDKDGSVGSEQISFILLGDILITFQEKPGDVFDPIRQRIRKNQGILRKETADYLLYALLDVLVDRYFAILEKIDETVDAIDASMSEQPSETILEEIHDAKRTLIFLRKNAWPLREVLYECRNRDNPMIGATTKTYFKDVYDHCIHVLDTLEIMKDLLSEMTELFLTRSSNRTNETMKFLTIISTIFMPLSFIAGVYGMNFLAMPELKWEYGYPVILGAMGGITLLMIFLFKRKRWF